MLGRIAVLLLIAVFVVGPFVRGADDEAPPEGQKTPADPPNGADGQQQDGKTDDANAQTADGGNEAGKDPKAGKNTHCSHNDDNQQQQGDARKGEEEGGGDTEADAPNNAAATGGNKQGGEHKADSKDKAGKDTKQPGDADDNKAQKDSTGKQTGQHGHDQAQRDPHHKGHSKAVNASDVLKHPNAKFPYGMPSDQHTSEYMRAHRGKGKNAAVPGVRTQDKNRLALYGLGNAVDDDDTTDGDDQVRHGKNKNDANGPTGSDGKTKTGSPADKAAAATPGKSQKPPHGANSPTTPNAKQTKPQADGTDKAATTTADKHADKTQKKAHQQDAKIPDGDGHSNAANGHAHGGKSHSHIPPGVIMDYLHCFRDMTDKEVQAAIVEAKLESGPRREKAIILGEEKEVIRAHEDLFHPGVVNDEVLAMMSKNAVHQHYAIVRDHLLTEDQQLEIHCAQKILEKLLHMGHLVKRANRALEMLSKAGLLNHDIPRGGIGSGALRAIKKVHRELHQVINRALNTGGLAHLRNNNSVDSHAALSQLRDKFNQHPNALRDLEHHLREHRH